MFRAIAIFLFLFSIVPLGGAQTDDSDSNLCYHDMAGQCTTDTEWSIGWFWGTNGVSEGSCKQYNEIYSSTVGDIWGMCAEYDNADAEWTAEWTEEDQAEAQRFFELTSRWHPMPASGGNPCPGDGMGPIIDYEENTFICASGF